ncbi:glycosyltransferase [Intrasporangium sp. DVR]|uniref:glycosyltransferase n=1 Tax=Intrasporangium sp. DVR TaxID=3127867 RepID=UPI00313A5E26
MKVSVVIPCYRSRATLPDLVRRLHESLPAVVEAFEVILVVDGSPDDTYAVARRLERQHTETMRTVLLRRNYGQHNALLAGIMRARHEVIITMDDDLQHRPEEVGALVDALADPLVDLAYGVPIEEEHGITRSFASRIVKTGLAASGVPNAKDVSALRAFRTDLRDGFAHVADPFASLDVLLSWTTNAVRRVTVRMDNRASGRSNYSLRGLIRHAMNMVTGYGTAPLKLVTWMGLATSVLGFALLVSVLARFWMGAVEVAGFTTLASMLAILSGALMLSIGILGEYIGRLHFRSMQKPTFLVKEDSHPDSVWQAGTGVVPPGRSTLTPDEVAAALEEYYRSQT